MKQSARSKEKQGTKYPRKLQDGVDKIFATMRKYPGGPDAIPHAERSIDRLIHYGILEPHKIDDPKKYDDPKELNFKLGLLAAMHSFRESAVVRNILPPKTFTKHKLVVDAHDTLCALRDNDLGPQNTHITEKLLEKPSLGLLVWMADLTQCYEVKADLARQELGGLDKNVFHTHEVGERSPEYRSLAKAALNIYSPLADALDYRDLSGDLMKMGFFHVNRPLHDSVVEALGVSQFMEENTFEILRAAKPLIEKELMEKGFEVEIHVRTSKNTGKAIGKVDKKLRGKCIDVTDEEALNANVLDEVTSLNDRVAFTVEVISRMDGGKKRKVRQTDYDAYDEVALTVIKAVNKVKNIENLDQEKLLDGELDIEDLKKPRGSGDGIYRNYIRKPKPNGYQSLHLDMEFGDANFSALEAQIKNSTMKQNSETGTAAHALYKEGGRLVRRAQKTYKKVLKAITNGVNGGQPGVVSTMNVKVIEQNGQRKEREIVLPVDATVADALAQAGITDLFGGLHLEPGLRLRDKLGGVRELLVLHTQGNGNLACGMFDDAIETSCTGAGRRMLQAAKKAVAKMRRSDCS
jgi:hypothetical protein